VYVGEGRRTKKKLAQLTKLQMSIGIGMMLADQISSRPLIMVMVGDGELTLVEVWGKRRSGKRGKKKAVG
jgi:hypothetical protein